MELSLEVRPPDDAPELSAVLSTAPGTRLAELAEAIASVAEQIRDKLVSAPDKEQSWKTESVETKFHLDLRADDGVVLVRGTDSYVVEVKCTFKTAT